MAAVRNRGTAGKTLPSEELSSCCKKASVVRSLSKSASSFHLLYCRQFHKPGDSLLSQPGVCISLKGFTNFIVVLMILFNFRLAAYNISRSYRYLEIVKWPLYILADTASIPPFLAAVYLLVATCISLQAEKLLAAGTVGEKTFLAMVVTNVAMLLVVPPVLLLPVRTNLPASLACIWMTIVVWLKLVSYHMVNSWSRRNGRCEQKTGSEQVATEKQGATCQYTNGATSNGDTAKPVVYPNNLNAADIWYFMFAPTLCYELNFPQRPKIRKIFLFRRTVELIALPLLVCLLLNQWGRPIMGMVVKAYKEKDMWELFKAYIDMVVWNTVCWIIMSFWLFHTCLNWLGELLRFADRNFYRDWWNADSVKSFWNRWNLPVHNWCSRHIYAPLVAAGVPKSFAQLAVFAVSAFFHEYVMSVPLKGLYGWAFIGMAMQLPLFYLYDNVIHERYPNAGNAIILVLFIFAMPAVIVMYYCEYYCILMGHR